MAVNHLFGNLQVANLQWLNAANVILRKTSQSTDLLASSSSTFDAMPCSWPIDLIRYVRRSGGWAWALVSTTLRAYYAASSPLNTRTSYDHARVHPHTKRRSVVVVVEEANSPQASCLFCEDMGPE